MIGHAGRSETRVNADGRRSSDRVGAPLRTWRDGIISNNKGVRTQLVAKFGQVLSFNAKGGEHSDWLAGPLLSGDNGISAVRFDAVDGPAPSVPRVFPREALC